MKTITNKSSAGVGCQKSRQRSDETRLHDRHTLTPAGLGVPIAVSPVNSLRSAAPQMRPCGPGCACAYVSGFSNSQGKTAGSSRSPPASGAVAREYSIFSSGFSRANAPDIPVSGDPDLVTAGVTWYRRRCVVAVSGR